MNYNHGWDIIGMEKKILSIRQLKILVRASFLK